MSSQTQELKFEQHAGINALINYSLICAQQCNVLKGNDDVLNEKESKCLITCAQKVKESFAYSKAQYGDKQ